MAAFVAVLVLATTHVLAGAPVADADVPPTPVAQFNAPLCGGATPNDPRASTSAVPDLSLVFGQRLADYNAGRVVVLYDYTGANGTHPSPPFCGTRFVAGVGPVSQWMFCTDRDFLGCGGTDADGNLLSTFDDGTVANPLSDLAGNPKLTAAQERIISSLILEGHSFDGGTLYPDFTWVGQAEGTVAQRFALQRLIWCISDPGPDAAQEAFCELNLPASEQAAILARTPAAPVLDLAPVAPTQPVGATTQFTVTTNLYDQPIELAMDPVVPVTACGGPATVSGTTLTVAGIDTGTPVEVTLCATSPTVGTATLTATSQPATSDQIDWHQSQDNGGFDCQVFAIVASKDAIVTDAASTEFTGLVSIGDFVWQDTDRDGVQDLGEPAVGGVTVELLDASGTQIGSTTTDANGFYSFTGLAPSTDHQVRFVAPAGMSFTTQSSAGSTTANDSNPDVSTGLTPLFTTPASGANSATSPDLPTIDAGLVGIDLTVTKSVTSPGPHRAGSAVAFTLVPHNNGPSAALAGWSVTEVMPAGLTMTSMTGAGYDCVLATCTDTTGTDLAAGADGAPITVTATIGAGVTGTLHNVVFVSPAPGDVPESNPLVVPTTTTDTTTTPTNNDDQADVTVGVTVVSIGDHVWTDVDRDGIQDTGEAPVAGVTVELIDAATGIPVATTTTDANGFYSFTDLRAGTGYAVHFVAPAGTTFTIPGAGTDTAVDSNPDVATGTTPVFTTPPTGSNSATSPDLPTIDAGLVGIDLTVTKAVISSGPYAAGSTVTFTLIPHNGGPSAALPGWSVTEVMPAGLTMTSMAGAGYDCAMATCTDVVGVDLAAGADGAPIIVTATIDAGATGTLHNVAYISPGPGDVIESNPLVVPTTTTDTTTTQTNNDDQADVTVAPATTTTTTTSVPTTSTTTTSVPTTSTTTTSVPTTSTTTTSAPTTSTTTTSVPTTSTTTTSAPTTSTTTTVVPTTSTTTTVVPTTSTTTTSAPTTTTSAPTTSTTTTTSVPTTSTTVATTTTVGRTSTAPSTTSTTSPTLTTSTTTSSPAVAATSTTTSAPPTTTTTTTTAAPTSTTIAGPSPSAPTVPGGGSGSTSSSSTAPETGGAGTTTAGGAGGVGVTDTEPLAVNPGGPVVTVPAASPDDGTTSDVVVDGPSTNSQALVRTGSDVLRLVGMGLFLLLAGSLLLVTARRRRLSAGGPAKGPRR